MNVDSEEESMDYEPSVDPGDATATAIPEDQLSDTASCDPQPSASDSASSVGEQQQGLNYTEELDPEDEKAAGKWMEAEKEGVSVVDSTKPKAKKKYGTHWSQHDTSSYRTGYPDRRESHGAKNAEFYLNKRRCQPDGMLIDEIHRDWWGDHRTLEYRHGYIQWLFPIKERGLNWDAQELNDKEIEIILANKQAHGRILTSFKMMLNFYGIELVDDDTDKVSYKRGPKWKERFSHLNYSMHNYMRITRILKCLGEFQYEPLKAPFIKFMLHEAIAERTLSRTLNSCRNYWIEVLKDDKEREEVKDYDEQLTKAHSKSRQKQQTDHSNRSPFTLM